MTRTPTVKNITTLVGSLCLLRLLHILHCLLLRRPSPRPDLMAIQKVELVCVGHYHQVPPSYCCMLAWFWHRVVHVIRQDGGGHSRTNDHMLRLAQEAYLPLCGRVFHVGGVCQSVISPSLSSSTPASWLQSCPSGCGSSVILAPLNRTQPVEILHGEELHLILKRKWSASCLVSRVLWYPLVVSHFCYACTNFFLEGISFLL